MKKLVTPLVKNNILALKAGDEVLLSGVIYTARDQAHKKLAELINKKKKLPLGLENQIIYYCGPTATPKGKVIGSCGPTTSSRMDEFVEPLLERGLLGMIGKGSRAGYVKDLIRQHKAVYFVAPAGCGALLAKKVLSRRLVCFKELGPEAVYRLEVRDFPLITAIDAYGKSIY